MPFPGFELACVAIIALTLVAMARLRPWRALAADYLALAGAGWVGEQTCVAWYDFYTYAPSWHARLGHVPLLVPLIWPLVILSARSVVGALWPGSGGGRAALVGALVVFDASLVEVIAVRAELWGWAEPGHLDVPLLGILGWGFFAAGASVALDLRHRGRHLGLLAAVAVAHLLIVSAWWGCFRWVARGDLGDAAMLGLAMVSATALAAAVVTRQRGRALPLAVAAPRMVAASLFLVTLIVVAPDSGRLWLHTALVAVPYLAATAFVVSGTEGEVPPRT